ncbi:glycosyltransferase family 2 protein [Akkermansiaceae bacterium]|nr:glycosyltransferase family 2 protein [Akkermansiaceae bacterium]
MKQENERSLVSVVVPTYNRAVMVCDALQSVKNQSYRPLQLLVVDDGSTDDTGDVVKKWADENAKDDFEVRYLWQENQGGNPARNHGIAEAEGEFVAFLDSDDLWDSEKLKQQVELFIEDSRVGAVYCGVRHVDAATGKVLESTKRNYPAGDILCQILVRDVTSPTSAYIVKRELFGKVGDFDITLQARQDWDMWIRLAAECRIGSLPSALVEYREHTGTRTASDPNKEINAYARIMEKYKVLRGKQPLGVRCAAKGSYFKRMGRVHFHQGISTSKAILYLTRSVLVWPFDFDAWAALAGMLLPRGIRRLIHRTWNGMFGATKLAIRSH